MTTSGGEVAVGEAETPLRISNGGLGAPRMGGPLMNAYARVLSLACSTGALLYLYEIIRERARKNRLFFVL